MILYCLCYLHNLSQIPVAQTKIKLNDRKKSTYATKRKIQSGKPTKKRLKHTSQSKVPHQAYQKKLTIKHGN